MNFPAKVRTFNPRIIYTKRQRKGERQEARGGELRLGGLHKSYCTFNAIKKEFYLSKATPQKT